MKCHLCGSDSVRLALKLEGPPGKLWNVYECEKCITQFIDPIPCPEELKQIYDQYYETGAEKKSLTNRYSGKLTFWRQWGIIRKLVNKKHGRILDFGCGGGHFLDNSGSGWDRYGIELSEDAREVATQKGIKTFATLEEASFPDGFFDVVVMFAVIEHLPNPKDVVEKLSRVLKSGGIFVIMTGDVTSPRAKAKGTKWQLYSPPRHIYFFSAQSLDYFMDSLGFEKVRSLHIAGSTRILFQPLNIALWVGLFVCAMLPVLRSLPLFDLYYGYYLKRKETHPCTPKPS